MTTAVIPYLNLKDDVLLDWIETVGRHSEEIVANDLETGLLLYTVMEMIEVKAEQQSLKLFNKQLNAAGIDALTVSMN